MSNAIIAIEWTPGQEAPTWPQSVIDANGGKAPGYSVVGPLPADRRKSALIWVDASDAALIALAKHAGYIEALATKDRALAVDPKRAGDVATFLTATAASAKPPAPITKLANVGDLVDIMCKEHAVDRATYEAASATVEEVKPEEPPEVTPEEKLLLEYGWKFDGKMWSIEHEGKLIEATLEEALKLTEEWGRK